MTLLCTVMAWGANVAKIGDTNYTSFNTAFAAATEGQTIVLLTNITKASSATDETRTVSANITIDGQGKYSISRSFNVQAGKTLTLESVTVNNGTACDPKAAIVLNNGAKVVLDNAKITPVSTIMPVYVVADASATIQLKAETSNTITATKAHCFTVAGSASQLEITGDGALVAKASTNKYYTFNGVADKQGTYVVEAPNAKFGSYSATYLFSADANYNLTKGAFQYTPAAKLAAGYYPMYVGGDDAYAKYYKIVPESEVYAMLNGVAYPSLSSAIEAAEPNAEITLMKDAASVEVSKGLVFDANGYDASAITAAEGFVKLNDGDIYAINGVATIGTAHYISFAAAYIAALEYTEITLWADAPAFEINKPLVINPNDYSAANITAGEGLTRATVDGKIAFQNADASAFAAFLAADGTDSYTLTEDVNIALAGVLPVNGTKTLTIPAGKKILYQRQGWDANILVNDGAKLTILGNGSVEPVRGTEMETDVNMANQTGCWALRVDGELVVGVEDADQPHFVSTAGRISGVNNFHGTPIHIAETGKATINNIDIHAAQATFWNAGETTINGGEFISVSSSQSGLGAYSYALQNYGKMVINDIHVQGTHGGLACQNFHTDEDVATGFAEAANTVINGGTFETVHGKNFITDADNAKDNYYAMYVSNFGIVNVYGGKFKVQTPSAGSNRVVLIGNNDYYNSYGVVNFYGGMYAEKAYVTKKKDAESAFPPSIPLTSAWYSAFEVMDAKNAYAPLPAGYEYQEITSGADYDAGYRWQVVCTNPNTDAIDEDKLSDPTIPWQQATTWATDEVPEESTIVTIPAGATVVVSNAAADIEAGGKVAVADQIFVNQGASVTVQTGTALTVGDGGVNIANGGSITVEPGAVVKIGAAGVITAEEEALVLESNDDTQAALLYDPDVAENTQPKATVKLTTKSKQIGASSYVFERFAIPTIDGAATTYSIEGGIPTTGLYNNASSFLQAVWGWNHETQDWYQLDRFKDMEPYKGYQLTNNTANGGLVYVFEGNLVGNANGNYNFVENGFHFFGNSYTADININTFLTSLGSEVEKTVWVYDPYDKNFKTITARLSNGRVKYGNDEAIKDIRSMQAFLMYLSDGTSGTATVDYESAIWGNPKYNLSASPAPARERETVAEDWATIKVASANGLKDEFTLLQSEEFSSAFENGADASKFMNKENINLYATTNVGNLAMVATDNIDRTVLAFAAGEATEYTISFEGVEGNEFTLRDIVTGAMVSMKEGATYTFTQEANTTNAARFEILGSAKLPTAIENVEAEAKAHGIYTIAGQFVGNDFNALSSGVYVVNGVKIVK